MKSGVIQSDYNKQHLPQTFAIKLNYCKTFKISEKLHNIFLDPLFFICNALRDFECERNNMRRSDVIWKSDKLCLHAHTLRRG